MNVLLTRPERLSALAAGLASLAFAALVAHNAPAVPYGDSLWPVALLGFILALRAAALYLRSFLFLARLGSPGPMRLDSIPRQKGGAYMGHAFEWTRERLEFYFEVEASGIRPPEHSLLGDWRIHAVGPKPRPLFLPLGILNQHKLIVSTTGGGKSRALEVDVVQAIDRGDALVVIDPKGDERLLARVEEECARRGRVLRFVGLPYPGRSQRYNPVGQYVHPHEIADRIALLLPSVGDSASFRDYAWAVVNSVVGGMILARDVPITLAKIKRYAFHDTWRLFERVLRARAVRLDRAERAALARWQEGGESRSLEAWYAAAKQAGRIRSSEELDDLVKLLAHPREHFQKMAAAFWPKLAMLTSGHLGGLLSPLGNAGGTITWDKIDRDRQVAYFYLGSLLGYTTASAVAAMTVADLISYVGRRYAYDPGASRRRLTIVVDELADVIEPAFTNLLAKSRGAGVSCLMAVQSLNDLEAKLGSRAEAQRVLANVNTLVQMLVRESSDAELFSGMSGSIAVRRLEESRHYEPALIGGSSRQPGPRASFTLRGRIFESPLVPPSLLQRLCIGQFFLMSNGQVFQGVVPLLPDPASSSIERIKAIPEPTSP